jgi:hypothetical protein
MPDRIIELVALPAPDLIAQINEPTSPRAKRTLPPGPLNAKRLVPAQPDEYSVDRNAGAYPANFDPARGARAWRMKASPSSPFFLAP